MEINSLLSSVLKKITPTEKEKKEVGNVMEKVLAVAGSVAKLSGLSITLSGSMIRNTWMPHKKEFDLFILFPENVPREDLEKTGLTTGKKIIKSLNGTYKIAYAEHPYVRGKIKGYDIDIVPCYKVSSAERIKSAVDRTPFHNRWLEKNLPLKLSGDVRLLKQFTKNIGVYGSDAKTLGFSGYLCEILCISYGSFLGLIKDVPNWLPGKIFIDTGNYYKDSEYRKSVARKFSPQPLIVIDPVDRHRNVAAALSSENFVRFRSACKKLLESPSESLFFCSPEKPNLEKIMKKRGTELIGIEFSSPGIIPDILWPQLRKTAKRLSDILKENEFRVIGSAIYENKKCIIILEVEDLQLPKLRKITGPEISIIDRSDEFIEKYSSRGRVWVENNCWFAEVQREFRHAHDKVKQTLNVPLKQLLDKGIPGHVAGQVAKGFRVLGNREIVSLAKKDKKFAESLGRFFAETI
jgi:tRNA nucleotidyltransferase (CCA-adding enzyme)